jgi:osmotically-inducible protein OsmY
MEELKWDARVQPDEIGVSVNDGAVAFTGRADSLTKKCAAEEAAHLVQGVQAVAKDSEFHLLGSEEHNDADNTAVALRAPTRDATLPTERPEVTVETGWISLQGEVQWQYQKSDTGRVARRLAGVWGVSNLVVVRPQITPSGTDVKRKIEYRPVWRPGGR